MLLFDFFNNKIEDRKQIEEGTRVPIIGNWPITAIWRTGSCIPKEIEPLGTVPADRYQPAVCRIWKPQQGNHGYFIYERRGKSFMSTNLAVALSAGKSKVLLIEMDPQTQTELLSWQQTGIQADRLPGQRVVFDRLITRLSPSEMWISSVAALYHPIPTNCCCTMAGNTFAYARSNTSLS